jgi:hypothetical protein
MTPEQARRIIPRAIAARILDLLNQFNQPGGTA